MSTPPSAASHQLHIFHVGCWVLGLIAFAQLVAVGVALGLDRQQGARPEVVERVEYVPLRVPAPFPDGGTPEPPSPEPVVTPAYVPPAAPATSAPPLVTL